MQKLKILFWSVVIGLFAGAVASYGFTGPGTNQPLAGNPIFWLLNGSSTYYVNGNVGIGTTTPGYTLDVSGGMRTTATSTFGGNVGIGTASPAARLDVNGSIRTGNDTTTCGSTNAGAVKYTSSSFYGCNGSSWRPIALVPKGSAALPGASCSDILADGQTTSGTYWINPSGTPFQVYCDMTTSGGGWTILLSSANTVNQCTNLGFSGVPSGACSATTAYASGADAGNNSFANLYLSSGNFVNFVVSSVLYQVSNSSGCGQPCGIYLYDASSAYLAGYMYSSSPAIYNLATPQKLSKIMNFVGCPGTNNIMMLGIK